MRLITLAALLTVASTLQACTPEQKTDSEAIFTALGAPLPAGLADPLVVADEVAAIVQDVAPTPEPVVVPPPPPPPPNEYQMWQTDPTYVCKPVFRQKSCTDSGEPVWLDSNMGWLPFGVIP